VSDDTRSFTLDGIVEVNPPAGITQITLGSVAAPLFYLRGSMSDGAFDAAPVLLDIAVHATPSEQAVSATQDFEIKVGITVVGSPPAPGSTTTLLMTADSRSVIQSLVFGAGGGPQVRVWQYTAPSASAVGRIILELELTGFGNALPDQQVSLRQAPVDTVSLELYTLSGTTWQQWTARDNFDASSRTDADFVLDPTSGSITFGSGERGLTPEAGALILAHYRNTAAAAGNVGPSTVTRPRNSPINQVLLAALPPATRAQLQHITTNRSAAVDGAPGETLDHALGRAVEILHAHERLLDLTAQAKTSTLDQIDRAQVRALAAPDNAVNTIDIERLALDVPGTRVDRARAWPSLHPDYPCLEAPGVVTVVIVPELPLDMPVPSQGLLEAVWRYLDRRRVICTSLRITGPQYTEITVTATVRVRAGASPANVNARIIAALNAFLNPLSGGPDALGWPFGRSVYRSEILQLIDRVPGVDYVASMSMQTDGGLAQCGDIPLCPMALVWSGPHRMEVS
jgi:hypothetical protein